MRIDKLSRFANARPFPMTLDSFFMRFNQKMTGDRLAVPSQTSGLLDLEK